MSGREKGRRSARKGSEKILEGRCVPRVPRRHGRCARARPGVAAARRGAEDLPESRVESAKRGNVGRPGIVTGACVLERFGRSMAVRVTHRVHERRLLREKQQEYATQLHQSAQRKAVGHGAGEPIER